VRVGVIGRQIFGAFLIPLTPTLSRKEAVKKFKLRKGVASLVARGRGKFTPPKPGGRKRATKHFPDFRRATPATWEYFYEYKPILSAPSVG